MRVLPVIWVTGADLSLASTGIARADIEPGDNVAPYGTVRGSWTGARKSAPDETNPPMPTRWRRAEQLARRVDEELGSPDLLVIEGPATYSGHAGALDLVGAWWLTLDRYCARRFVEDGRLPDVLVVAPSKLKKYVTGHGHADKVDMVKAVRRHYGDAFDLPLDAAVSDVADSIGLLAMGARFLGCPIDLDLPHRLDAMAEVALRPARKARKTTTRRRAGKTREDRPR